MNSCARCGAELRAQNAGGVCVRCLLESGLDQPAITRSVEDSKQAVVPGDPEGPATAEVLRYFDDYELLEEIARGGMGVVYRARQPSLERIVAVKMILAGQFASKQIIQRFRGEVTAAALLQHPNIVAIHDVGIHDDQHYFSMDYVAGQNLSQLVGNRPLPPGKAARYVKVIAEAIHYAHEQGILHRDLKPSNVLIDSATDQPRITDFGLAKRLDGESTLTLTGQVLGSPNFMPPEQASNDRSKVGRHSDVYGLGAILYYLLTARAPFQADSLEGIVTQVLQSDPVSPRILNPSVPRDLETICLKCLNKESSKRYATASELAEELGRFLSDEPIQARPVTPTERAWRWCRRKPALAGLGATLMLVFTVGFAATFWQWRHAVRNAKLAEENREHLDQNLYDSDMSVAQQSWDRGDLGLTLSLLKAHEPHGNKTDRRGFEWYYFWNLCKGDQRMILTNHTQAVNCLALSPDGKLLATGSVGSMVQIWDMITGNRVKSLPESNVVSLAFAPDSQTLGVGGRDQMIVWDIKTGREVFGLKEELGNFRILFPPVGKLVFIGIKGGVRNFPGGYAELWDYSTRARKQIFPESGGHIALSSDGKRLATGNSSDGTRTAAGYSKKFTKIWDVATATLEEILPTEGVIAMAFSPDGRTLATSGWKSDVELWDLASQKISGWLTNAERTVWNLAYSPKDNSLAAACADQTIHLFDLETRQQTERLAGHGDEIMCIAYSQDGQTLASGSKDKTARLWSVHQQRLATTISNVTGRPRFSPGGRWIAAPLGEFAVGVWDATTLEMKAMFDNAVDPVAFSEDSQALLTRGTNYFLRTYDLNSQTIVATISKGPAAELYSHAALSPNRQILAIGYATGALLFADAKTGVVLTNILKAYAENIFQVAFSPDGKFLATAGREVEPGRIPGPRIWDVATHKMVALLAGHGDIILSIAFSPDGKTLASCGVDNTIRFWDTRAWKEIASAINQMEYLTSVTFSPDRRTLASASADGFIRLWSATSHRELAAFKNPDTQYITFSPDGQKLAAFGGENQLRLLRAPKSNTN